FRGRQARRHRHLVLDLWQLLRPARALSRRPVRAAGASRQGLRQEADGPSRQAGGRPRRAAYAMVGAGLEQALHRFLPQPWRPQRAGLAHLPAGRRAARGSGGPGMSRRIVLVLAVARNGTIGAQGAMPWRLPEDLKHFKAVTMGKPIVMGRKTWDSFPRKPLP